MGTGRIVVVEDDTDLREQMVYFLKLSGIDVTGAGSAAELYRLMATNEFAIIVLDLQLPDEDGLSVAAHVRGHSGIGIIMVTARNQADDRVRGREAGADVYLSKPVDLRELVAAIHTLSRRLAPPANAAPAPAAEGRWRLDRAGFRLSAPAGPPVPLTANEVALLTRLTMPSGVTVPRGELLATLGYDPADASNRNLDAALRRLRLKVEELTDLPLPLRTVHSVGYLIDEDVVVTG